VSPCRLLFTSTTTETWRIKNVVVTITRKLTAHFIRKGEKPNTEISHAARPNGGRTQLWAELLLLCTQHTHTHTHTSGVCVCVWEWVSALVCVCIRSRSWVDRIYFHGYMCVCMRRVSTIQTRTNLSVWITIIQAIKICTQLGKLYWRSDGEMSWQPCFSNLSVH
jgi:hypothetical protein